MLQTVKSDIRLLPEQIMRNVQALCPGIKASAERIRQLRRMPTDIADDLRRAGALRIGFSSDLGGPDMRLADQVRLVEMLAMADASIAWNVMILCDSGYFAGRFKPAIAREIWPSLDMGTAAPLFPPGRAERVAGGYRITGRFRFGSGIHNAGVAAVPCYLHVDGRMVREADGRPEHWQAFPPRESIEIHDSWHVTGLCGTGSNDYSVNDVFVPERHMFHYPLKGGTEFPPLSRYRGLLKIKKIGVVLGLTKTILDEVNVQLGTKMTPKRTPVKNEYRAMVGMTQALGLLHAARAYALETAEEVDDAIWFDRPLERHQIGKVDMMSVMSAQLCRQAADMAFDLVGTDQIFLAQRFAYLQADLNVVMTHATHKLEWLPDAAKWLEPDGEPDRG
ncbi:Acyl-CoA dehydrogenase [Rhizobiales bacterium GAS191]|nr:Acyl-CoA dehydrogenase [Rhizobiales bacterium GAS191]